MGNNKADDRTIIAKAVMGDTGKIRHVDIRQWRLPKCRGIDRNSAITGSKILSL